MALAHCILCKFLGVGCHCFPPPLDVPTFSARCLHVQRRERPIAAEGGTLRGREMFRRISSRIRLPRNSRDLLHAADLRHGTDGFTSPPKEGVLRIYMYITVFLRGTSLIASKFSIDEHKHVIILYETLINVNVIFSSFLSFLAQKPPSGPWPPH